MNTEIIDAGRDISGGYKVDVSRGGNVDRVSSEWFSRPDDERYLSLDDLFASVKGRAERSRTRTVRARRSGSRRIATTRRSWGWSCRAQMNPSRRRIGPSASSRASSARPRPICGNCPRRWRGSTCSTG
jgi:hypothetical protein